jgi:hypothetical protein
MLSCQVEQECHVSALAIEVHRDDGLGPRGHTGFHLLHGEVERRGVDVHKDRYPPQADHGCSSGEEGERCRDDLIAVTDADRHQSQQEGIAPRGDADSMRCAAKVRHFALKGADIRSQNEPLTIQHCVDRFANFRSSGRILSCQIN